MQILAHLEKMEEPNAHIDPCNDSASVRAAPEKASATDEQSLNVICELSLHPCYDSIMAPEKASAIPEESANPATDEDLSLNICDNSTSVAAPELEEIVVDAPKVPEFPPMVAVDCAPVQFVPVVSRVFPSSTDSWHHPSLAIGELMSGLLRLQIFVRIRLLYYSLKMLRIK